MSWRFICLLSTTELFFVACKLYHLGTVDTFHEGDVFFNINWIFAFAYFLLTDIQLDEITPCTESIML